MISRRTLIAAGVAVGLVGGLPAVAIAQDQLSAVATFSILGDMVAEVGGERVAVTTLVGPDGDAHVYSPTPADARSVAEADILFANGLGFEGWMDRLVEASGYKGPIVVATMGIDPLEIDDHGDHDEHDHDEEHADHKDHDEHGHDEEHAKHDDHDHDEEEHADHKDHDDHDAHGGHAGHDHGDIDPHAWQSLANAKIYVTNIAQALSEADPEGASVYTANRDAYLAKIETAEQEITDMVASLPDNRKTVITSHDAFGYFAHAYGLRFVAPQGISTESEASAADVATLIRQIREEQIPAIFVENVSDPRLLEQIQEETDARIGGTLYSDALSGPDGPAGTYLDMMRHNAMTLGEALRS